MIQNNPQNIENIIQKYLENRARYYDSGDGSGPSRELSNIRSGLNPLIDEIGHLLITQLDAPTLAGLRDKWAIEGRVVRSTINKRLQYAVRLVRWCIEQGICTGEQLKALECVERIKRSRYGAKDTERVKPANLDDVQAVLEEIPKTIRSMMELIQLTGMRPGEVRIMKLEDLERLNHKGRTVFRYTIPKHKTAHLGKRRRVFITGKAYSIIVDRISTLAGSSLFEPESNGYLFSPHDDGQSAYAETSIPQSIRRACRRLGVDRWTPNQLRHGFATETRAKGYQLELIADLLGHSDPRTTLIYAEPDDDAAMDAMLRLAQ